MYVYATYSHHMFTLLARYYSMQTDHHCQHHSLCLTLAALRLRVRLLRLRPSLRPTRPFRMMRVIAIALNPVNRPLGGARQTQAHVARGAAVAGGTTRLALHTP